MLEADIYLSILSLFSRSDIRHDTGGERRNEIEYAAFNILAQLCVGSAKGRKAVTGAAGFGGCFDRALDLVSSSTREHAQTTELADGGETTDATGPTSEIDVGSVVATGQSEIASPGLGLVEAAFSFLSSTIVSKKIQDALVCNSTFIQACSNFAREGRTPTLRGAAVRIIARLARCTTQESELTSENTGDLLLETLVEQSNAPVGSESQEGKSTQVIAADGLYFVFDKLSTEKKQTVIQEVGKVYTSVLKSRSLSKSMNTAADRLNTGELAYCLTRIMLLGMGNESVETIFGTSVIMPLVGTVQWRFDTKTVPEDDELVYWDASTTHALQILASWLEQGKSFLPEGSSCAKSRNLKENVWMVARPGKAPRKAIDFGTAVGLALKTRDSSARLASERVLNWLNENY